jgi:hypothetical protein
MSSLKSSALAIALASASVFAQPQTWQVVVLHPPGAYRSWVNAIEGGIQYGTADFPSPGTSEAGYWRRSPGSWTPLSDPSLQSVLYGADPQQQVGQVHAHAALWRGTPESLVDLHPLTGVSVSGASAVAATTQVGGITLLSSGRGHAALWHGTAESFVDLHPAGAYESSAVATDGMFQGGYVTWSATAAPRATLWQGTAGSFMDVNPAGASYSEIRSVVPGAQVGYVYFPGSDHAALWHGTAASYVDLNPPGATLAQFYATTGSIHVGVLGQGGLARAAINFGTPNSWVSLQQFLPPTHGGYSQANAVYQDGATIYVGGWADNATTGFEEAILWIGTLPCYANCDESTAPPILNANDFQCFLNKFVAGDASTNCDGSSFAPVLNANDFQCFINQFAAGCS